MTTRSAPTPWPSPPAGAPPPPQQAAWRPWATFLVVLAAGAALAAAAMPYVLPSEGLRAAKAGMRAAFGPLNGVVALLLLLLAGLVAIAAHELGHLLGAALARFRFELYVVGPLRVYRDEERRVRVGLNRSLANAGGIASALPEDTVDLRRRTAYVVAGGPLASLLLALAAAAWQRAGGHGPVAFFFIGGLALISGGIVLATLPPTRSGGMATDGLRLLRLIRGGPIADRDVGMLPLAGLVRAGEPPREWPEPLVRAAATPADASAEECVAQILAYYYLLDSGRAEEAGRAMDRALALAEGRYPAAYLPAVLAEGAYHAAAHRGDAEAARRLLARVPAKSAVVSAADRLRAEAALKLAEGDAAGAADTARRALGVTPSRAPFGRARLEELVERAGARS